MKHLITGALTGLILACIIYPEFLMTGIACAFALGLCVLIHRVAVAIWP